MSVAVKFTLKENFVSTRNFQNGKISRWVVKCNVKIIWWYNFTNVHAKGQFTVYCTQRTLKISLGRNFSWCQIPACLAHVCCCSIHTLCQVRNFWNNKFIPGFSNVTWNYVDDTIVQMHAKHTCRHTQDLLREKFELKNRNLSRCQIPSFSCPLHFNSHSETFLFIAPVDFQTGKFHS